MHVTNQAFLTWMFFSIIMEDNWKRGRAGSWREVNNKGKGKLESVSNLAEREKDKSYCRIPSVVKNNGKEGMKISKLRREKLLAQICRKDLTEGKLEKNKNKNKKQQNNAFCLALIGFSHKIHNIRIENQILILS